VITGRGATTWMKTEMLRDLHVLIEMTDEPNCRFVGNWLSAVADAEAHWSEPLSKSNFRDRLFELWVDEIPSLEVCALEVLGLLQLHRCVIAAQLYKESGVFSTEFALMVRLGFFTYGGRSYRMTLPKTITVANIEQAALELLSTSCETGDGVEVIQPGRLLYTVGTADAHAWRSRLLALRHFKSSAPGARKLQ
jgi:hypothetical protein